MFFMYFLGPTGGSSGNSFGPGNDMNTLCNMDAGMMSMGRGGPMLGPDGNPVPGPEDQWEVWMAWVQWDLEVQIIWE